MQVPVHSPKPAVLLLAAGRGRRFGAGVHKLEQRIGSRTVLGCSLAHALESGMPVVVVTTARLAPEAARLVAGRDIVVLPDAADDEDGADSQPAALGPLNARSGMGRSIAAGVQACSEAAGWLVMPADMPLVRPQTLRAVAAALARSPVAYAQHQGHRGHPVGFAPEMFSELLQLRGDQGARRLLARYPCEVVETDDAGVLLDVDTPEDLERCRQAEAASLRS